MLADERQALGLDPDVLRPDLIKIGEAARALNTSTAEVEQLIAAGTLGAERTAGALLVSFSDLLALRKRRGLRGQAKKKLSKRESRQAHLKARRQRREEERTFVSRRQHEVEIAGETVQVAIPERARDPDSVVFHLGPTNSGKTHDALEFLVSQGRGVYAAPLRMLAQEAYQRLHARLGDQVGLLTGEERINENAPILCCTVEMAPLHGQVLVLDEVHWAADRDRGSAWMNLLIGGDYQHIRLVGAVDALPLLSRCFPRHQLQMHERKLPLEWIGARSYLHLPAKTVVVAFSRKAVLALGGELNRVRPGKVIVLYGAMPIQARREAIARFISGEADICIATDVLGHGVNLPCDTLLFAETSKWDGLSRRELEPWELAQIAGRAGRYGLSERGHVGVLSGIEWAHANAESVQASLVPHVTVGEGQFGYRTVEAGRVGPRLEDLNVSDAGKLEVALKAWESEAARVWADEEWLEVEPVSATISKLESIRMALADGKRGKKSRRLPLSVQDAWTLARAPADEDDGQLLGILACAVAGREVQQLLDVVLDTGRLEHASLEQAESAARTGRLLRWFALRYPGVGGVNQRRAAKLELAGSKRVLRCLDEELQDPTVGRCKICRQPTAPWLSLCDSCYRQ